MHLIMGLTAGRAAGIIHLASRVQRPPAPVAAEPVGHLAHCNIAL